jgi:hypothetical protein
MTFIIGVSVFHVRATYLAMLDLDYVVSDHRVRASCFTLTRTQPLNKCLHKII